MNILIIALDILLAAYALKSIYVQSQIMIRGKYNFISVVFIIAIGVTILAIPDSSWAYIVLMALFVLVNIMAGVSGLATKFIVTPGLFGRHTIKYHDISAVTLVPALVTKKGLKRVIMFITTKTNQQGQLVFDCHSVTDLKSQIGNLVPQSVPVTVKTMPFN